MLAPRYQASSVYFGKDLHSASPVVQNDIWSPDLLRTHVNNFGAIVVCLVPWQVGIHPLLRSKVDFNDKWKLDPCNRRELKSIVVPPNSNTFFVSCHSLTCHSLTPWGNNNRNFRLIRDQVALLEIAANFWTIRRKANDFFAVFFSTFVLGGITKHLMTGAVKTVSFVSPRPQCFPWCQSFSAC